MIATQPKKNLAGDINFNDFKVRCSSISKVLASSQSNPCLTEKQAIELSELEAKASLTKKQQEKLAELLVKKENGTKVILSDTCTDYLMEEYAWRTERKVRVTKEIMDVHQMQKGTIVEGDSLLLLSKVDGVLYKPNKDDEGNRERISNDYLSGEIDAYEGTAIMGAETIVDAKSVWDYPTFLCMIQQKLSKDNDWQVKGYLNISGAPKGIIAKCLVNTPPEVVEKIRWKLLGKLNVATDESTEFKEKWEILERSMYFDNIPHHKRVWKLPVEPMTAIQQQLLYDRVKICREWLNNFHEMYQKININDHE